MRSGWLPNDRHLTTNLKQDPQHRHPDDNAITYYAFGRPLLIDPGKYSYSDNPITNWLKTTEAHNTIEVDDLDQNLTEGWFRDWTDNKKFTFVTGNTRSVPGTSHTRETLFLKSSFSIVSDYLQSTGTHKYQQTWHFLPGANLTLDTSSKKVSTKFNDTKGNLQVVPADPLQFTATLDNGYYSPSVSQYQNVQYASYTKSVTGDTYFDTVLYPTPSGETRNVTVERLATTPSVSTTVYSALKINNIGETGTSGYYYISHEDAPRYTRNFDTFAFDGKLAYAEKTSAGKIKSAIIKSGSTLKNNGTNMISSNLVVNDMAVDWNGTNLDINGSNLVVSTSPASYNGIAIYAPGVATVKLNGSVVTNFGVSGNYIYAAGVPSSPVSSGMASYDLGAGNTGVQKMEFDLRPQANNQTSIIGYTGQLTAASTTDELPIQLRLNANGYFQAYNGTAWTSLHTLAYDSTKNYHITMIADLYSQKYNLYIAPYNEQEVQIADDYAFKTGTPQLSDIGTRVTDTVYNDQLHLYNHTIREAEYFEAVVTDDAMVRSGNSSYNNGYAQQLDVGGERATLLRFNLAHISGNVTPEFSKLELTSASSGTYTDQAKLLSSDAWKQSTVTFGNMPTAGQVVASWNTPQANRPIIIDIHSQLLAQWNGDKLLSLIVSSTSNITHQYFSKEQGESRSYPKIKVYTR